jgi:hypothetical protein
MGSVDKRLPSKPEALSSISSTTKKKKKKSAWLYSNKTLFTNTDGSALTSTRFMSLLLDSQHTFFPLGLSRGSASSFLGEAA